mgnify:CR=1 FL=1
MSDAPWTLAPKAERDRMTIDELNAHTAHMSMEELIALPAGTDKQIAEAIGGVTAALESYRDALKDQEGADRGREL